MRDDGEFPAWLAARWPPLVRSLVFLGHPQQEAERIALEGLSRVLPTWQRLRREDDVDVELYREVLDERERQLRHHGSRVTEPQRAEPVVAPGLSEQAERRAEVEAALAAMSPADRELLVLQHVAELTDTQVADVVGRYPEQPPRLPAEDVRFAAEAVPVGPVQPPDVADRVRARRRRWWRHGATAVAVLAVVIAGATWLTGRSEEPSGVTPAANPLPVPWFADGTLHLADVEVEVRPVHQLVRVPDGVVLTDDRGAVVMVDRDGRQDRIGDTVPGSPLVVEPDNGWVAWADPNGGDPELVVHDTRAGEEVGRRSLAVPGAGGGQPVGESRPVAIDGERVYYNAGETDFAWEPLMAEAAFAVAGSLVDTAGGARVSRDDAGLLVQPAPFRTGVVVPAVAGRLTPDGRFLFAIDHTEELVVYDVAQGRPLEPMLSPSDRAVAWGYVEDGSFLFAVLHRVQDKEYQGLLQLPDAGDYRVYHCDPLAAPPCGKLTEIARDSPDPPVLAR